MISRRALLGTALTATSLSALAMAGCSAGSSDGPVSVYSWRQEDGDGYRKIFDIFTQAHADITVKFEPFNSTDYDQILATAMQSGDNLDLIQLRPYAGGREIADTGDLAPLDDMAELKGFSPESLAAVSGSDGKVYGVPTAQNALITLYNKEIFDQHKIARPSTWPEFLDACAALKKAGLVPIAQSGKAAYLLTILYQAVATSALSPAFGKAVDDGSADFTSQEFRDSVQRVLDLKPYVPESFIGMADDEARAMFAQGRAAMYINGDYRIKPLLDLNPKLQMDYLASLPEATGPVQLSTGVDGAYALMASSPRLEQARALLAWMATEEFGSAFATTFSRLSQVPGAKAEDPLHVKLAEEIATVGTENPFARLGGGNPDVKAEFENALQGVLGGQISADELFAKTQEAYQASRQR